MLNQTQQDMIWEHMQNHARDVFDLSYSRLRYLVDKCKLGDRVLNIGVGSGELERMLKERGVEVWSLDPNEESIARLQNELEMGNRAAQGYSQSIPFLDEYFDKVIMTEVLEHLPDDILNATLDEIFRVLKTGGIFTGTVPYRENLRDNNVICPHCQEQFHRWGHQQSFDKISLRNLLVFNGFIIDKLYPRSFPDFRRRGIKLFIKSVFRYVLGRMGEPLVGPNLYFVSHK
ncbi:MAG: class I SAM-dependent methyltransferase [Proteobacteria bacterium]|nr:class I SAM-dependent methyltransferase [Pseudomonadota bacterium]NOG59107.1 class I SAM-dependent methyltransferase [Pseudomonadota bacterium]